MMHRRSLLRGLGALLAAPAIVRASSLMPISVPKPEMVFFTIIQMDIDRAAEVMGRLGFMPETVFFEPAVYDELQRHPLIRQRLAA